MVDLRIHTPLQSNIISIAVSMQIGIKADWRGSQGRMVLFVGNKHTAALMNVRSAFLPPPHLRLKAAVVPESIPPRAQVSFSHVLFFIVKKFEDIEDA